MIRWSPKQREVVRAIGNQPNTEVVVVVGPVQSGKTLSAVYAFLLWAMKHHTGQDFLLASSSRKQLQGAVLRYAEQFSQLVGGDWRRREEWYQMRSVLGGTNRFFPLLGGKTGSEAQARSFSAMGALGDEATLLDPAFVNALADRCSRQGAKLILVTNPAGPAHPIKEDWVDRANGESLVHIGFELADNPTLSKGYVEGLHRRYHGAAKRRMVYGEWAVSGGAIFPHIAQSVAPAPDGYGVRKWMVGVDWAHSSVTHAVLVGELSDGRLWVLDEWRHDAVEDGALEVKEQARRIARWLGTKNVSRLLIDPSAVQLWRALRLALPTVPCVLGDNDVLPGISYLRTVTEEGRLWVADRCAELVRELHNYTWDERAGLIGVDKPVKERDHGVDALRYVIWGCHGPKRQVRVVRSRARAGGRLRPR